MSSFIVFLLFNVMFWEFCFLICVENNCIINRIFLKKKNLILYYIYMYIFVILFLILIKEMVELYFGVFVDKL